MKFGMNLLLWSGEMNDGMIPVVKMLKNLGYDGVELPIFNTGLDYAKWGKILDDMELGRTAVTIRGVDDNPISSDAKIRQKGIEGTMRALDCCAAAGCTTLVGPFHSALGHFSGAGPTADEWKWGVESMRAVAEHAGKVMTHRQILTAVWGEAHRDDVEYLRVYVRQLRSKLGDDPADPHFIETEPGVGYRLKGE